MRTGVLIIIFLLFTISSFAQTPGLILKPATGSGAAVLDPNGDGYASQYNTGYVSNDFDPDETELDMEALVRPDPPGDPVLGPTGFYNEIVGIEGTSEYAIFTYIDGSGNFIVRFRLDGYADNSKSYTLFIDTDEKFGFSGVDADPDATTDNPGFELEVSLHTNFYVRVYDIDNGTSSLLSSYSYDTNCQKSIAMSANSGDADYFYDFFVPLSAMGITSNTPIRAVGITSMNPNQSLGNNSLSDIGGENTTTNTTQTYIELIEAQTPTPPGVEVLPRSDCPTIDTPLLDLATTVTGTSTEGNGSTATVYVNGSAAGTGTVSSGTWSVTVSPLSSGDVVTASITASGEGESSTTCNEVTVGADCTAAVTFISLEPGDKGVEVNSNSPAGTVITVYESNGTEWEILKNGVPDDNNPFTTTVDNQTAIIIKGNTGQSLADGRYYVTAQFPGACPSDKIWFCVGTSGTTATPVITTPIAVTDATIDGTGTIGATVYLYTTNEQSIGSAVVDGSGNWSITPTVSLTGCMEIFANQLDSDPTLCISNYTTSVYVTSNEQAVAPIIYGADCIDAASFPLTTVSGFSVEASGTIIEVFNLSGPTSLGTATVDANGNWSLTGLSLSAGTTVYATATDNTNCRTTSASSTSVTITAQASNVGLSITTTPITENVTTSISGTGTDGYTITVLQDGYDVLTTATVSGTTWTATGITASDLTAGSTITVTQSDALTCESLESAGVTVACETPANTYTLAYVEPEYCEDENPKIYINASESGIIYTPVLDSDGSTFGYSILGTGGQDTLTVYPLTSDPTLLRVKATKIGGVICESTSSTSVSLNRFLNPADKTVTSSANTICSGETVTITVASYDPAATYTLQDASDNSTISSTTVVNGSDLELTTGALSSDVTIQVYAEIDYSGKICSSIMTTTQAIDVNNVTGGAVGSNQTINSGDDAAVFTDVTASTGDGTLTYQWQNSTDNVTFNDISGATSNVYDPPVLTQTTYYKRVTTSTLNSVPCTAESNTLTVTVSGVAPIISVQPQPVTVCDGDPTSFTVTASGATSYQWQVDTGSGFGDITNGGVYSGATTASLSISDVSGFDLYVYRVNCINIDGTTISSSATLTINTVSGGTVSSDQSITSGDTPAGFTETVASTGTAPQSLTYQWQISTDGSSYSDIVGATATTYSPGALTQTTYYKRITTNTLNSVPCTAESNVITITVTGAAPTITAQPSNATVCDGTATSFSVTATGATSYQWKENGGNITDGGVYSGATTATLSISAITGLDANTYSVDVINLNGTTTSSSATLTINFVSGGTIVSNQTINSGDTPSTLTETVAPSGTGTTFSEWYESTDGSSYTATGITTADYSPGATTQTTYYKKITTSTLSGVDCIAESNVVTITVSAPTITVQPLNATVCDGDPTSFTVTATGAVSYQWKENGGNISNGGVYSGATTATLSISDATGLDANIYTVDVINASGTTTSSAATLTINNVSGGTIGSNQTINSGDSPSTPLDDIVPPSGDGTTVVSEWFFSTDGSSYTATGVTTTDYSPGSLTQTTYYKKITTSTLNGVDCTAESNVVTITVNSLTDCSYTIADQFAIAALTSNDGTINFTSAWTITGDGSTGGSEVSTGSIRINDAANAIAGVLAMGDIPNTSPNTKPVAGTISRDADLTSIGSVTVSFDYTKYGNDTKDDYYIHLLVNGISKGTPVLVGDGLPAAPGSFSVGLTGGGTDYTGSTTFALKLANAANTGNGVEAGSYIGIDNFQIAFDITRPSTTINSSSNITCYGDSDGSITLNGASGGTGTYEYTINGGTSWQSSTSFTALAAGTYDIRVRDASYTDCEYTVDGGFTLTQPAELTITPGTSPTVCQGATSANLSYSATTGSPDQYSINFDATAESAGFVDVNNAALEASPIVITVPGGASGGTYNATLTVNNTSTGCSSIGYAINVYINAVTGGTIAADQSICYNDDPVAFTQSVASSYTGSISYQWQSSTDNVTFNDISGATATTYDPAALTQTTYYKRISTSTMNSVGCTAESNVLTITVTSTDTPTGDATQTFCSGATVGDLNADDTSIVWYDAASGGSTVASGTAITDGNHYYATQTENGCESYFRLDVTALINDVTGGTIATDQSISSGGDPAAFTESIAATYDGTPSYQWQSSADNITFGNIGLDDTDATYDPPSGFSATTYYKRITTSTLLGVLCTAESNVLTITLAGTPPSITTQPSSVTVCDGAGTSFTVVESGGTSYQWQVDTGGGFIDITDGGVYSGATTTTLSISDVTGLDGYLYRINVTNTSGITTSSSATLTINDVTGGSFSSDQTICSSGDPSALTESTGSTGDGPLTYQWQSSTDGSNYNDIVGATEDTYDPAALTQTTYYKRITTSTLNSVACTAESNVTTITVNSVSGGTIAANQTVCYGDDPVLLTEIGLSTGSGDLSYQWQISTDGSNYSDISGANATTYDPPASITQTSYYKRVTISLLNSVPCTAESNVITVTVNNVSGGTIAASQSINTGGDPAELTVNVAASADGTLSYQWQSSTDGTAYTDIALATSDTYDPPTGLATTTFYKRIATSTLSGVDCSAESNVVTVTVSDPTACNYFIADYFTTTAFNNNDGDVNFAGNWTEINDDAVATTGLIQINTADAGALSMGGIPSNTTENLNGLSLARDADLSGIDEITISFNYSYTGGHSNDDYSLGIYIDGSQVGSSIVIAGDLSIAQSVWTATLSNGVDYTADTNNTIALTITDAFQANRGYFIIDDFKIDYSLSLNTSVSSTDISCFGLTDGTITIGAVTGGTGSYEYSINGGSSWEGSPSYTGLSAGSYNVMVRDASYTDCEQTINSSLTLTQPTELTITLGTDPSVCPGITNADLTYSATSGTPDKYNIDFDLTAEGVGFVDVSNAVLPGSPIGITVPGGAAGNTYNGIFTITNSSTGCTSSDYAITVTIDNSNDITIDTQPANAATCAGDGVANFQVLSSTSAPGRTWQWYDSGDNPLSGLPYSGTTSSTLSVTDPSTALDGESYYVIITETTCNTSVTSASATLTVNTFSVALTPNGASNCPDLSSATTPAFDPNNTSYNAGATELTFRVVPTPGSTDWSFDFDISGTVTVTSGASSITTLSLEGDDTTAPGLSSGTTTNGTVSAGLNSYVDLVFNITNTQGSSQAITINVTSATDNTTTCISSNQTENYTIESMPAVGSFN